MYLPLKETIEDALLPSLPVLGIIAVVGLNISLGCQLLPENKSFENN